MQQTRRSITHLGDLQRFGRFLAKLRAGEAVTVVGIGSSVTVDYGGSVGKWQREVPGCMRGAAGGCGRRQGCVRGGWLLSFFERINASWPHAGNRLVNCGEAASRMDYFAACLGSRIDTRADLVVVEPVSTAPRMAQSSTRRGSGDHAWGSGREGLPELAQAGARFKQEVAFRSSLERVLRLVLRLPRRPAVVLFNSFSWRGPLEVAGRLGAWNYSYLLPLLHESADAAARDVAEYYGLPVVSTRAMLFHAAARGEPAAASGAMVRRDGVHPTPRGEHMYSRALWHVLEMARRTVEAEEPGLLDEPHGGGGGSGGGGTRLEALPAPAWASDEQTRLDLGGVQHCWDFERFGEQAVRDGVASPVVLRTDGWQLQEFVNLKRKPGWLGTHPGATVTFHLTTPTPAPAPASAHAPPEHGPGGGPGGGLAATEAPAQEAAGMAAGMLHVTYLESSERVGAAELSCEPPCACEPQRVDARVGMRASVHRTAALPFWFTSPANRSCTLRCRVLPRADNNPATEFKVLGFAMSLRPE